MIEKPAIGDPCNGCGLCCRTQVCSIGSFTLGLVNDYGDRAPGPCPALVEHEDGKVSCGLVSRPKDHARGKGGAHELRKAVSILIGAGIGCDEAGNEADADSKLNKVRDTFMKTHTPAEIERALHVWFGI